MLTLKQENRIVTYILFAAAVIYIINTIAWDGSYGGGDGIRHYLVARYSWKHPEQLLYHWGKPFFTLVSSPSAQFGLYGIKIFNSLLGIATGYIAFLIARKLNLKHAWLVAVLILFTPLFVQTVNSGLTEPLFAFIIILCAWLFMNEKYFWPTILISFLPFVRSEGNLILPLFAFILFIRKQIFLIPFLTFGTIAYSIIGYFYYHDLFWIQTQNPYKGLNFDIYGKGPLNHYVMGYDEILGLPLTVFYCIGLLLICFLAIKKIPSITKIFSSKDLFYDELFLIHAAFIIYFVAHSIFWWKGLFGSLGLIRSMAGVVPFAAFTAFRGAEFLLQGLNKSQFAAALTAVVISAVIIFYAFQPKYFPLQLLPEEVVIKEACDWYKTQNFNPPKIYYLFPWLAHGLDIDAFDGEHVGELWGFYNAIKEWGLDAAVPIGTIIFWDAHFGANEAYIPLDSLLKNPNYKLIKTFQPDVPIKTLGGYDFTVNVFERIEHVDRTILDKKDYDLESGEGLANYSSVKDTLAHSGSRACVLNIQTEFGIMYERTLNDMPEIKLARSAIVKLFCNSALPIKDAVIVCSVEDENSKAIFWEGELLKSEQNKWTETEVKFLIPEQVIENKNKIKIYIWNKNKETFVCDDLIINFN